MIQEPEVDEAKARMVFTQSLTGTKAVRFLITESISMEGKWKVAVWFGSTSFLF
jgi:hypothetical protein